MTRTVLLLIFLFIFLHTQAQQQVFFETLTQNDGLSDNRVTCFLKDKNSFLWVGTRNGLNRYNGHSFSVFIPNGNSISNELINDIAEDKQGFVWVATMSGLNSYHPTDKKWHTFQAIGRDTPAMLLNPIVWDMYVDEDDKLWIATDFQGVSYFDNSTQKFTHYPWKQIVPKLLPQYKGRYFSVLKIVPKSKNELWLGTTFGLVLFNKKTGTYSIAAEGYEAYSLEMLYNAEAQKVFISNGNNRVFCYDEKTKSFTQLTVQPVSYPSVTFTQPQNVFDWMGASEGLLLIDAATNKVFLQKHIPELSVSLPQGSIRDVYTDPSGITWLAGDNGIVKYDLQNQLSSFLPLMNVSDRMGNNPMAGMLYDEVSDRYFLCSTTSATVFIADRKRNIAQTITKDASGKQFNSCRNIRKDRSGKIWLLADDAVYYFDFSKNGFVNFSMPKDKGGFRDMLMDTDGNYWFSGFMGSLSFYDTQKKKFTIPADSALFSGIQKSNPLFLDTVYGNVWIGTFSNGVYKYHIASKKFTHFTESPQTRSYTPLNLTHDITQDKTGAIWVATHSGGLFKYKEGLPYEKSFVPLSMKEGLSSNNLYAVKAVDSNLWVLSGSHLFYVNIYSNKITKPVSGKQVFPFASFASDDYWPQRFAYDDVRNEISTTVGGGILFFKTAQSKIKEQFPLVMNAVYVNGVLLKDSLMNRKAEISSPLKELVISFSALHYSLPQLMQYEYKLEGFDAKWQQAFDINKVQYQNLPSGNYQFKLKAKSFNGTYAQNEISVEFKINPFYWQTWWFVLLCAGFIAAGVYALYKYQLHKKLEVERLRHRISRDLHDDVGSALTTINVLSKVAISKNEDAMNVQDYLTRIKASAEQTMESMSDIVWAINPQNDSLDSMLVRMKEYAAELCEAAAIELEFDIQESLLHRKLDVDARKNVFLIFKEAVNNAVKYSRCKKMKVSLHGNGGIHLQVKDDGVGFLEHRKSGGNGLKNMEVRAKALKGNLTVSSKTNDGTQINLFMPYP
jgi:signal transduction histidine kinase/ligand-binding sensor domain-containing protein